MKIIKKKEPAELKTGLLGNSIDYGRYQFSKGEHILYFLIGVIGGFSIGYIFYESLILSMIVGIIVGLIFVPVRRKQIIQKRKDTLLGQFKDMLESISTSLGAGNNIQDAFVSAQEDAEMQYGDESYIYKELDIINQGVKNNINIEELLLDFGDRSQIADITNFANVFETCYRKGGNIKEVLKNTYFIICDKIDIALEIKTVVASQKNEQNIMMAMPVIFVLLFKLLGSEIIDLTSVTGRISTTIAIICFAVAYALSKKILDIKL